MSKTITTQEAIALFGSKATFYRWMKRYHIAPIRRGGKNTQGTWDRKAVMRIAKERNKP